MWTTISKSSLHKSVKHTVEKNYFAVDDLTWSFINDVMQYWTIFYFSVIVTLFILTVLLLSSHIYRLSILSALKSLLFYGTKFNLDPNYAHETSKETIFLSFSFILFFVIYHCSSNANTILNGIIKLIWSLYKSWNLLLIYQEKKSISFYKTLFWFEAVSTSYHYTWRFILPEMFFLSKKPTKLWFICFFTILNFKLCHFKVQSIFSYATNTQA